MKKLTILLACLMILSAGCKTKKNSNGDQAMNPGNTTGKVSHQYQSTGCNTVIIVTNADDQSTQVLIPNAPLPDKFDKDGLSIKFNYRLLKMPNPPGCGAGNVAEITDVAKD